MTIYPVVQERLLVSKELVLVEEVRVTQRDTEVVDTRVVTLHREQVDVERLGAREEEAALSGRGWARRVARRRFRSGSRRRRGLRSGFAVENGVFGQKRRVSSADLGVFRRGRFLRFLVLHWKLCRFWVLRYC